MTETGSESPSTEPETGSASAAASAQAEPERVAVPKSDWARWEWERKLPPWQQKLNRFCENWIFAFIIAMAIRHFGLEAYRIPTASMEPMLYGDPSLGEGDFVVVDKALFRFTGPDRWDVTVFQFPWPEVGDGRGGTTLAWNDQGERLDNLFTRPLLHRNFVKRCVVQPGDEFYICGGDLYLRQGDSWVVPPKPASTQEALWQLVYSHGAQLDYLPWVAKAAGGSEVRADDQGVIHLDLTADEGIHFDQPLRNLYVKDGPAKVQRRIRGRESGPKQEVEVSMTSPQFTFREGNKQGSIWDMDRWNVYRLTSADLDNDGYGRLLNDSMDEYCGDFRVSWNCLSASAPASFELTEGDLVSVTVTMGPDAWQVQALGLDGLMEASGEGVLAAWQVVNCDNVVTVLRDGKPVLGPLAVAATNPNEFSQRTRLRWYADARASLEVADVRVERDLHYCARGFLADESQDWTNAGAQHRISLLKLREQIIPQLADATLRETLTADMAASREGRRSDLAWLGAVGNSPETALVAPEGAYLLLGDNSPLSWDSRNWGWVPERNLRGQALVVVFPVGRWHVVR